MITVSAWQGDDGEVKQFILDRSPYLFLNPTFALHPIPISFYSTVSDTRMSLLKPRAIVRANVLWASPAKVTCSPFPRLGPLWYCSQMNRKIHLQDPEHLCLIEVSIIETIANNPKLKPVHCSTSQQNDTPVLTECLSICIFTFDKRFQETSIAVGSRGGVRTENPRGFWGWLTGLKISGQSSSSL